MFTITRLIYVCLYITCGLAIICPKCSHVQNVNLCGEQTDQCDDHDDVCIGTLKRWKISMGCASTSKCQHLGAHNTTDCSGNHPFGPRDTCTVCCTGHECNTKMKHIQQGLNKIADVLHCPVCKDEQDPQRCMDNFVPCDKNEHTCEIEKENGLITSRCYKDASRCLDLHYNANSLHAPFCIGTNEKCRVCCNDHDCIEYAFGMKSLPTMSPGQGGVGGTSPTLTFSPPTTCRDQTLFPCHLAVGEACTDPDISTEFCRLTCGVCRAPSTTAATVHVTTHHVTTEIHVTTTSAPTTKTTATTTASHTQHVITTHASNKSTAQVHHVTTTHAATTTWHHVTHTATAIPTSTSTGGGCPDLWTQFDGSCYLLVNNKLTFVQAIEQCETQQGYLIEVETARESTFLKAFLKDKTVQNGVWLGGNDMRFEGYFVWDKSEKPLNYTDWYPGEPNQTTGDEDCMSSWKIEGYQWGDHYCDKPDLAPLCERPVLKC